MSKGDGQSVESLHCAPETNTTLDMSSLESN